MQQAQTIASHDPVAAFIDDAYRALTDLGLRNKMISLPAANRGRSMDLEIDPDVLVEKFLQPGASLIIGSDFLPLTVASRRPNADLKRSIVSLIADAEVIASEQGIETRRLAIGAIEWRDPDGAIRTAPLFTMPVTVTPDLVIAPAGPLEPNETFSLFAASFGCTIRIDSAKPPSQALAVKAHAVEPVKAGGIAILGYTPRVNLNLYAGKSTAMHRALDISARPHLASAGAIRILAGVRLQTSSHPPTSANLHVVDADISQDEAISAARAGESFVLQGPPGTGKSQTIVNIVANLLNDGKRVLVSAEKKVALDVIADRWPQNVQGLPAPIILTENSAALSPETRFAVSTPAVAAQKIPPGTSFDVLIVDEASQIRLSHAAVVASLAEQVIVIGDSQQMAPSNLFSRISQSQVPQTMIRSLLDHAVTSGMPTIMLKQHYRSKQESLILFSNEMHYDGQLDIIPSPLRDGSLGASFKFVPDAVYDRGGNGDNPVEAHAVIADLIGVAKENRKRRQHPGGFSPRSVGVITLNEAQRDLILTLLPDALAAEGLSENDLTGRTISETLFVKSLENVQGDERDIILVSMTYGPDQKGRFIANLGVLSQPGARNRVNVLATRAKWKTIVYHSFDIATLNGSGSDGANAIWTYWRSVTNSPFFKPLVQAEAGAEPVDDLDTALRLMQRQLAGERFSVHRFPRFIAGFDKKHPIRYTVCFYFTGLFSPLQQASDIARLKGAGWKICEVPIEQWRTNTAKLLDGLYRVMVTASSIMQIEL